MNVILFHTATPLPEYIQHCIQQIKYYTPSAKIFLITDVPVSIPGIYVINIQDIPNVDIHKTTYYKNDGMSFLFRTSAFRFFYIKEVVRTLNLKNTFHFDNDVLIYKDLKSIIDKLSALDTFKITKHKITEAVCGMLYIKDFDAIQSVCLKLEELMLKGEHILENELKSMPHEMRLLGHISQTTSLIQTFPVLPTDENFSVFNSVFDPSSYGQYIGGTHGERGNDAFTNRMLLPEKVIDKKMLDGNLTVHFDSEKKQPYIVFKNQQHPISNLHIHSKQLSKFISY